MSTLVKEYKLQSGKILEIHVDDTPESPREWDNLGTVCCIHRRYNLCDKHAPKLNSDDFDGWDAIKRYLIKEEGAAVILPIYMYDHGGITIATTPFGCRWDSGQIGFIYCTGSKIKAEYGVKRITKKTKERVENVLKGEIETYNQYVTGDVYGFKLMRVDIESGEREEEDACWGFYGDNPKENGMNDHIDKDDAFLDAE